MYDDDEPDELDSPTRRHLADSASPTAAAVQRPSERTTSHDVDDDDDLEDKIKRKLATHDESTGVDHRGDPLIGSVINERFHIVSKIGAGGMGAVYRAKQLGMNRDVAIKVLLRELTENEVVLRRFHLEALAVSKLKHPNTIQIFDFGETSDGLLYIAMELLEGRPLAKVLSEERQLSVQRALRVIEQTCKSLREAHSKGIVHRDLKPDNIFLSAVGEDGDFVKVLDFGVAKVAEGDGQQKTLTKAGSIFGTPKYMSPEQSRGSELDARSDIYALGVILYELITGKVPFNADNPLGILIKHIQEVPPPIALTRPDLVVPESVERFVLRLLAKSPEDRPQTAEAMIREIEKLLQELPPLFRNVVTRADAEAAGIEIQTLSVTSLDTDLGGAGGGATMHRADTMLGQQLAIKRRRWPIIVMAALVLLLGTAGGLYASLAPLDKGYYDFTALSEVKTGLVAEFDVNSVIVTLASEPLGADVINEAGAVIGQTPLSLRRNQGAPVERYTIKKESFRDYSRSIEFDKDGTVIAKLEPLDPVRPPVGTTPVGTTPVGTTPKTDPTAPPKTDPTPPKTDPTPPKTDPEKVPELKTNPFDPKKVDETKDNPYGTGSSGKDKKDEPKDNPYD
ncbi:MAG: serine/threonine protein kinase [Deltaproteobacteria bacterium]|nr:serine/threonine protein kinase [Deltaproteobacteria bacterium]